MAIAALRSCWRSPFWRAPCRSRAVARRRRRRPRATAGRSRSAAVHPPPPPAETLPAPAEVPAPARRGGALRVHLDAEPTNLLPLAESDAAAAQVTNGLVYETLLDCRDGTYKPGLAESWDVSNDGMRLAVRVRSGVHWHDHRAFGVLDVQATVEPLLRDGDRRAGAARRAGRRRVDRARHRADRPLRAQASVGLRAAGALRRADAARSPGARRPPGGVADRAAAGRDGAVPLRRLGARQAHPARARARVLGPAGRRRRDRLRPRSRRRARAQPHPARRASTSCRA